MDLCRGSSRAHNRLLIQNPTPTPHTALLSTTWAVAHVQRRVSLASASEGMCMCVYICMIHIYIYVCIYVYIYIKKEI